MPAKSPVILAAFTLVAASSQAATTQAGAQIDAYGFGPGYVPGLFAYTEEADKQMHVAATHAGLNSQGDPIGPYVSGMASATTGLGVTKIGVGGGWAQGPDAIAAIAPSAYSRWTDEITITGPSSGNLNVTFSGVTSYKLSTTNYNAVGGLSLIYWTTVQGAELVSLSTIDFATGHGLIKWTQTVELGTDTPYLLDSYFSAEVSPSNGVLCNDTSCSGGVAFDSMHTTLLSSIVVPDGYSVSDASGSIVASNDSFVYKSVMAAAVPEPEVYTLMLAGLGVIGVAACRRKPAH